MDSSCINSSKKIDDNVCLRRPLILKAFYLKRRSCLFVTREGTQNNLFSVIQLGPGLVTNRPVLQQWTLLSAELFSHRTFRDLAARVSATVHRGAGNGSEGTQNGPRLRLLAVAAKVTDKFVFARRGGQNRWLKLTRYPIPYMSHTL